MDEFKPVNIDTKLLSSIPFCDQVRLMDCTMYKNSTYTVIIRDSYGTAGLMKHLSVRRNDREPIHDWRDLQEIKNQLFSPEHEAVELYPKESRRVDTANQYHLWVLPDQEQMFGFGYEDRMVINDVSGHPLGDKLITTKQRPIDEEAMNESYRLEAKIDHNKMKGGE